MGGVTNEAEVLARKACLPLNVHTFLHDVKLVKQRLWCRKLACHTCKSNCHTRLVYVNHTRVIRCTYMGHTVFLFTHDGVNALEALSEVRPGHW